MRKISSDIHVIGDRFDHTERRMREFASTINDLVDAHDEHEHLWMNAKLADLEDRSRRNNVKINGISEIGQQSELRKFATVLLITLLPELNPSELITDRICRLPRPSHLPEQVQRDVLLCIHFFYVKEQLMLKI